MKHPEIVILYNEPVRGSGADDWDVLDQVLAVEEALHELDIPCRRTGIHEGFMQQVDDLKTSGVQAVFNLVEAIRNKGELNYFIPALLVSKGIAYSGNPLEALFITTNKRLTCQLLQQQGIRVPASLSPSQWAKMEPGEKYILKPVREEGSAGITAASVFTYRGEKPPVLEHTDDPHWFIEKFVEGREFNISLLNSPKGPEVLPFAEILFRNYEDGRPRIVDYHAKWTPGSFEYENTVRVFPDLSGQPDLAASLQEAAVKTWNCLGMKGYARVDMRADAKGNVFVLEANANPCISPGSGFAAATAEAGYSFASVVKRILDDMNQ